MPRSQRIKLVGTILLVVVDRNGRTRKRMQLRNTITNIGKAQVAGLINGVVSAPFRYIAIGDGNASNPGQCSSESATDTALGHEVARQQASVRRTTTNVTNDTAVWDTTFTANGTWHICESGIFDASSGGNMLARKTFSTVILYPGDQLYIQWKVTVS